MAPNPFSCIRLVLLLLVMPMLRGQTVNSVPGFLQDLAGQYPLPLDFSLEQQIQIGTQGNSSNANPFAYGHALQFRPWLHYDGIPNATLTGFSKLHLLFHRAGNELLQTSGVARHPDGHSETTMAGKGTV